jgi:S-DNA-T family DNA segregation ATPase FtsK/SpoIIIE
VATETHQPDENIKAPSADAGRWDTHKAKAKSAYGQQKQNAWKRLDAFFTTADIDDHRLAEQVVEAKRRKAQQQDDHLLREVASINGRLANARVHAAQQGKETTPQVERIRGELAAAQARVETRAAEGPLIAVVPPTHKEVDRARWTKKATRVAAVLAGGYGYLQGIFVEPGLILLSIPAAGFGWWYLSRPHVEEPAETEVPFGLTPASLPATFQADPAGEATPIVGGNVVMSVEQLPEGAKPFPIRGARTPDQLAQCVLLAAKSESVPIVEVSDVRRQPWGWQCVVRVSEGTPEALITKSGDLETRFDLPTNGVRPQPIKARRACAILRLVDGDPFATAPGLSYRAPKSMSITDKFRIGTSVGGDPLELSLAGVMGLWVAASGGGKTGILQALAEGTAACYDNITIDLDPHGDGLEDLGDCVRITARTNEQIEAVLLFFLVMSKARARLRQKLGMGKKWKASAKHPAVTIFFDEFPKATDLAKKLAFDLLLVGRKELIEVEIASQGGQKGYLGENFAQMVALKAVGPCKVGDTRAVFGDGSVNEGYLPHKLSPATDTDPKDAGHIYLQGVPGRPDEPIEYAIHETPSATLRKLAEERLEAGLVEPDQDSLDAMRGVDLPEYVEATYDNDGNIKKDAPVELLTWDQLLRLCGAQPIERGPLEDGAPRRAVEDSVAVMEKADVDRMKTETLLAAVQEYDLDVYGLMTAEEFKALMKKAGAGAPITLGPIGEEKSPRGFKRDRLRHLL